MSRGTQQAAARNYSVLFTQAAVCGINGTCPTVAHQRVTAMAAAAHVLH